MKHFSIKFFKWSFIVFLTALLFGCGFHPRHTSVLPEQYRTVYIDTNQPYSELMTALKEALHNNGVSTTRDVNAATLTLHILHAHTDTKSQTLGPSNNASAYVITYYLTFALALPNGKEILGPQTITSSRTLSLNPDQSIANNNQADITTHALERDIIHQLFYVLSSKDMDSALHQSVNIRRSS